MKLVEEENATLGKAKAQLEEENVHLQNRVEELDDEIRRLEYEKDSLKANLGQTNGGIDHQSMKEVFRNLAQLPKTLAAAVEIIGAIHPERIAFTEGAIKSAGESRFDDVHRAWKVLWAMATTLYDLFFERDSKDIPRTFRNETGIELAMTERKITKQDNRKMAQRKDMFMGQEIDITPHVKFDADTTRAYFRAFRQNGTKRIVVGHIGHLETEGTKRGRG